MNPIRAASFTDAAQSRLQPVPDWPQLPAGVTLDRVVGVDLDSRGLVHAAHRGAHPLLRFHPDGRFDTEIGAGVLRATTAYDLRGPEPVSLGTRCWLHGLHLDPWDNIWITDVGRHLVMKFHPTGELLLTLGCDGEFGCDSRHFHQPTHVCVVPSGEVFVTDGYGNARIVKFSARGEYLSEWGAHGTAPREFHTPHAITLGPDGLLYMTDRENDRVQVFDQQGKLHSVWPGLHSVDGLHAAPDGFIYGSAGIDNAIIRFDHTGRISDVWAHPGLLNYPHALAVGNDGALCVAETGDRWKLTGRLPPERETLPRTGAEGSALTKLVRVD